MVTRRQFLVTSAGAGAGFIVPVMLNGKRTSAQTTPSYAKPPKFTDSLPIPFASSSLPSTSTLTIKTTAHKFHSSLNAAPALAYNYQSNENLTLLGPTLQVTKNSPVSLTFKNNIVGGHPLASAIDTTLHGPNHADDKNNPRMAVHFHGINAAPEDDGYPTDTFLPGGSFTYDFNNKQEAATLWYHDHALGITGINVLGGLAGLYLIRDEDDPAGGGGPLGIPAGEPYEVPLVLQDRFLKEDGSIYHPPHWEIEYVAPIATINGKAWPKLDVERTLYRFRIVNGSSARTYNLKLSSGQKIIQIGGDQGFLNAPVYLSNLLMAPGERADVLIDFSDRQPGENIVLQNLAVSPYPFGRVSSFLSQYDQLPDLMQFTVKSGTANKKAIPQQLRKSKPLIQPAATYAPIRQRYLTLVEVSPPGRPPVVLLQNYLFWHEVEDNEQFMERPKVDTVEQWNIINLQPVSHPMHLHLVPFRILNRQKLDTARYLKAYTAGGKRTLMHPQTVQGVTLTQVSANYPPISPDSYVVGSPRPPAANEAGWKDTVLVNPNEVVRLIVPFGANAAPNLPFGNSYTGRYVWHCHMLGHEDNEMMLPYTVIP
ncbi:MAG TPA: multicopper oxidase domain-containing protein [Oculatellaceae cyanobacterium]|jgi:FtsP/CotA-like multicopper oxidase with cupredoxin domain